MFYNSVDNLRSLNVKVHAQCEVQEIDFGAKTIIAKDLKLKNIFSVEYDKLILSTGSVPQVP